MKLYRSTMHFVVCVHREYFTIVPNIRITDILNDPKYTNYIIPKNNNIYLSEWYESNIKYFKFFTKLDYEHNREIWWRRF